LHLLVVLMIDYLVFQNVFIDGTLFHEFDSAFVAQFHTHEQILVALNKYKMGVYLKGEIALQAVVFIDKTSLISKIKGNRIHGFHLHQNWTSQGNS
jgi:hypothetical protein